MLHFSSFYRNIYSYFRPNVATVYCGLRTLRPIESEFDARMCYNYLPGLQSADPSKIGMKWQILFCTNMGPNNRTDIWEVFRAAKKSVQPWCMEFLLG